MKNINSCVYQPTYGKAQNGFWRVVSTIQLCVWDLTHSLALSLSPSVLSVCLYDFIRMISLRSAHCYCIIICECMCLRLRCTTCYVTVISLALSTLLSVYSTPSSFIGVSSFIVSLCIFLFCCFHFGYLHCSVLVCIAQRNNNNNTVKHSREYYTDMFSFYFQLNCFCWLLDLEKHAWCKRKQNYDLKREICS